MLTTLLFGIGCPAAIVLPFFVVHFCLRPPEFQYGIKGRTQYKTTDFFCLTVVCGISLAVPRALLHELGHGAFLLAVIPMFLFCVIWWTAVRDMASAGIENRFHRCFFIVGVTPIVWFGGMFLPVLTIFCIGGTIDDEVPEIALAVTLADLGLLLLARQYIRWLYRTHGERAHRVTVAPSLTTD